MRIGIGSYIFSTDPDKARTEDFGQEGARFLGTKLLMNLGTKVLNLGTKIARSVQNL